MTAPSFVQTITSPAEAARARSTVHHLARWAGLRPLERVRLTSSLTAHLQRLTAERCAARLNVQGAGSPPRLHLALYPQAAADTPVWQTTLTVGPPEGGLHPAWQGSADGGGGDPTTDLVEALFAGDADASAVLDLLEWHSRELEETNRGVVALHAELAEADRAQRLLLASEQAARLHAERMRARLTFLSGGGALLSASLDRAEILRHLDELLVPGHAERADVWLTDHAGRLLPAPGGPGAGRPVPDADHPVAAAARTGLPQRAAADGPDAPARLALPLTARNTVHGVLDLVRAADFDPDDVAMLTEFAGRAAVAFDNAQRYERERHTAETLQRAMLTDLPTGSGVRLAARYLPATRGMNVGGDWYDAFTRPDGSLLTVVGDVTGHGLRAAVMMGQLRHALRAYGMSQDSPGELLTRLHVFLRHTEPGLCATAVIAHHRPGSPEVTWATAGHLPALLRGADGETRALRQRGGAMLGLPMDQTIHDHRLLLAPGSALLLYTDGLVERRREDVALGIDRLAAVLGSSAPLGRGDTEAGAEDVLNRMLPNCSREDDICFLLTQAPAA
ncbi:GAF domain-containing protein [Kitasatospora sp. SolWspMP-SS2h]|uniref:PP2C family protein-serine/threonine phosphatase n=1 Tax=Kitasatospora sp. SolWspMP-SS2h TaxID=1305729 RepID=UPI000DB9B4D9|nr:GAF domain-containing SpoIIE family protein phosphatase [Kitasatospora sp. SolWspMP-SS2h]RAJ45573.1 GAF domain-containing protein [Kitasatospora sp. SolWspMP-SS2h]